MTKEREALKLALEAFNDLAAWNDGEVGSHMDEPYAAEVARRIITAIKSALANEALERKAENARELGLDYEPLEAKDEPMEFFDWYDNAHWGNEDFKEGCHRAWNAAIKYTAKPQQEAKDEPWEKFCDSNCVWTDHHPDCKLAEPEQEKKQ